MTQSDIKLYQESPESYESLQLLRDDYRLSIEASMKAAVECAQKGPLAVVDFCGGTGLHLRSLAEKMGITTATIVDINEKFLSIAQEKNPEGIALTTIHEDIRRVSLPSTYDLVLSIFAYHHVPDADKENYLRKAYEAMKPNACLILTEIYLPDAEITAKYYEKVLQEIPREKRTAQFESFVRETALSTNSEFKVSKEFADQQTLKLGLKKVREQKIWPTDGTFAPDIGTFVTVLRK